MVLGMARRSLTLTRAARRSFAIPVLPPSPAVSTVPGGVSAQDVPCDSCPLCHLFVGSQTGWRTSCSAGGGMWGDTDSTGRRSQGLDGPCRRWQELCHGLPRRQPGFGQQMEVSYPHPLAAVWSQMQQSRLHPLDSLVQPAQTQHSGTHRGVLCRIGPSGTDGHHCAVHERCKASSKHSSCSSPCGDGVAHGSSCRAGTRGPFLPWPCSRFECQ